MLPPGGSEEPAHVHPLRGGQSAAGETSYAAPVARRRLYSQWAPDSHGPVAQWSQGTTGKWEGGLRPLHRPLQGGKGGACSRGRGWEGDVQVWRMEGVLAVTAQEACKEGSETCRGDCTNINTENKGQKHAFMYSVWYICNIYKHIISSFYCFWLKTLWFVFFFWWTVTKQITFQECLNMKMKCLKCFIRRRSNFSPNNNTRHAQTNAMKERKPEDYQWIIWNWWWAVYQSYRQIKQGGKAGEHRRVQCNLTPPLLLCITELAWSRWESIHWMQILISRSEWKLTRGPTSSYISRLLIHTPSL